MKRRFACINVLILAFYLFHALSPLLYSAGSAQAEDQPEAASDSSTPQLQAIVVDHHSVVGASPENNENHSTNSSTRVLLKKKRAIPASSKEIIEKLSPGQTKPSDIEPTSVTASVTVQMPRANPVCPNGFQYYHSGTSPPSA